MEGGVCQVRISLSVIALSATHPAQQSWVHRTEILYKGRCTRRSGGADMVQARARATKSDRIRP